MNVAVLSETIEGEKRVALVPEVVKQLSGKGFKIVIQSGAGAGGSGKKRRLTGPARIREPGTASANQRRGFSH